VFFISSLEAMRPTWLSKLLNLPETVTCYPAAKGLLPLDETEFPDIERVFERLGAYERLGGKTAGIAHLAGRHGLHALHACEKFQSVFMVLLRNPVEVTHLEHIRERVSPEAVAEGHEWARKTAFKSLLVDTSGDTGLFIKSAVTAFEHHFGTATIPDVVKFPYEGYSRDYAEIERMLSLVIGHDDKGVRDSYAVTNGYSFDHWDWEEIFADWTDHQRLIFRTVRDELARPLMTLRMVPTHYSEILTI